MQNVNSGATPSQSTGYVTPAVAGDYLTSPPVASLGAVLTTPGLNPELCLPEAAILTNDMEPITDRNVELALPGSLRNEISGAFQNVASPDAVGLSSMNAEMINISDMKKELMGFVRPLLSQAPVYALGTSGNSRGQLAFIVTADHNCTQNERQMLCSDVEHFWQDQVPKRLRNEFNLKIQYDGPVVCLSSIHDENLEAVRMNTP